MRFLQLPNTNSRIFVTLAGMEISSINEKSNENDSFVLMFDGREISLISRLTNILKFAVNSIFYKFNLKIYIYIYEYMNI